MPGRGHNFARDQKCGADCHRWLGTELLGITDIFLLLECPDRRSKIPAAVRSRNKRVLVKDGCRGIQNIRRQGSLRGSKCLLSLVVPVSGRIPLNLYKYLRIGILKQGVDEWLMQIVPELQL